MLYHFDHLSFGILTVDRVYHNAGNFKVKGRPFASLSFRVRGTGTFRVGEKSYFVNPGDLFFLPARTPYEVEYSESESIIVHLEHCNYFETEVFCMENTAEVSLLFAEMLREWNERHSINRAKATVYNILDGIDQDKRLSAESSAFYNCLQYVEAHFCDPGLNIGRVCEEGFISPSSLERAFLRRFGMSPKQYVTKLRMNRAVRLLIETGMTVKEVSYACGFSDEKYFSRAFKNQYGYPPTHLKNNMT